MDSVSNALSKIKNACMVGKKQVELKSSNLVREIVAILKKESFISDYSEKDGKISVSLSYMGREPKMTHLKRISKPGQRRYIRSGEIKPVLNGRGIGIISTSGGIVTSEDAKAKGLGGEYICQIW